MAEMADRERGGRPRGLAVSHVLSVVLTILPLGLVLVAFILAAVSASSAEWSYRDQYKPSGPWAGLEYRSPFWGCINNAPVTANGSAPPPDAPWIMDCVHVNSPAGLCDFTRRDQPLRRLAPLLPAPLPSPPSCCTPAPLCWPPP